MQDTYRLKVAGLERDLNICPLNDKMPASLCFPTWN